MERVNTDLSRPDMHGEKKNERTTNEHTEKIARKSSMTFSLHYVTTMSVTVDTPRSSLSIVHQDKSNKHHTDTKKPSIANVNSVGQ